MNTFYRFRFLLFSLPVLCIVFCTKKNLVYFSQEKEIIFQLNWKPEPEFGGFYAANLHGIFKDHGFSHVVLKPSGKDAIALEMVETKKAFAGISGADEIMLARSQGAHILPIFAVYQDSPLCVLTRKNGSSLIEILKKRKVIAWDKGSVSELFLHHMVSSFKLHTIPYSGGIHYLLFSPPIPQEGFITSEYIIAQKKINNDVKAFLLKDFGFNPYMTVVFVHQDTAKYQKEVVKKLIISIRKGWMDYLEHPQETNRVMYGINKSMDLKTFEESSEIQKKFIIPNDTMSLLGGMTQRRWEELLSLLIRLHAIKNPHIDPPYFFSY